MKNNIIVSVAYATSEQQWIYHLDVLPDSTVEEVLALCQQKKLFIGLDYNTHKIGIYGQLVILQQVVKAGDRIEIYRPLIKDPMTARRLRAKQQ